MDNTLNKEDGQLSVLYRKWKEDPDKYSFELSQTVDKIIYSTLSRQSLQPFYWRTEDRDDMIQDLRVLCWKKLNNINPPITNKRIFNFLRVSIKLALKEKARKVGKRLDREAVEYKAISTYSQVSEPFSLGDPVLDRVAFLLLSGQTKSNIREELNLSRGKLNKYIDKLREIYKEEVRENA